jgi:raffinose/stachyose/melibiose transport system substrate-binding protein
MGLNRRRVLLHGAAALIAAPSVAHAQSTTIRMLHIETNRAVLDIWQKAAAAFEAANAGVKIEMRSLEAEAFKTRLPTILQSDSRPHIFYSWGGQVVDLQAKAGFLEDIGGQIDPTLKQAMMPAAMAQFTRAGRVYGLPYNTAEIGILINRDLFARAGVTEADVSTWPGFTTAVRKFKSAGIQPLVAGGQDKWHLGLFLSHLCLRTGGRGAVEAAMAGGAGGFEAGAFTQAAELYRELCAMSPYQDGFMASKAQPAAGQFADGKAAMLMHGTWFVRQNPSYATDKKGLSAEQMGFIGFPLVPGGAGTSKETQVNLNGWLVSRGAPKAAVDWLKFFHSAEVAGDLAAGGFIVPANTAARSRLEHPIMRLASERIGSMDFIQLGYNVLLGPNAGKVSEDIAVGIATGRMTPKDAMTELEKARQQDERAS